MQFKRGNALPLVLGVLLVLSILLSAMLRMPGTLRRTVAIVADETQEMYWAESAVLAKLEGFPELPLRLYMLEQDLLRNEKGWNRKTEYSMDNHPNLAACFDCCSCIVYRKIFDSSSGGICSLDRKYWRENECS